MCFFASIIYIVLLIGYASAFSLTNQDVLAYRVEVTSGQGFGYGDMITVNGGALVEGLCKTGCSLTLPNGFRQSFTGAEDVSISNGTFTITE